MSMNSNIEKLQNIISTLENKAAGGGGTGGFDHWQYVTQISNILNSATLPEGSEVTFDVPNVRKIDMPIYGAAGVKKLTFKGNVADNAIEGSFSFAGRIEEVDLTEFGSFGGIIFASTSKYAFRDCTKLKYIRGVLDLSNITDTANMFRYCSRIEEIRFSPLSIKVSLDIPSLVLSDESIQSIIDGLADLTGQTAQTLTLHATVGNKLTQTQKDAISAKNWTVTY